MSEQAGEKTEQPTPKKHEEAQKKGQIARSPEVQTVFVLAGALIALLFTGQESWRHLTDALIGILSRLHDIPLNPEELPTLALNGFLLIGACVWPIMFATALGGVLAGGIQTRFRTTPEALQVRWERLNPATGFKRVFSFRSAVPTGLALLKLIVIIGLTYGVVKDVMQDPIFSSTVQVARIAEFLAFSAYKIVWRVVAALLLVAVLDYAYQTWRTNEDLKMTKQEVKDEHKNSEGNPHVKAQQRRRRQAVTQRKMMAEVPHADVVVTNPTHLAVALRYDRRSMSAPRIVAKGSRLHAQRIREIARQHQVPIQENKPLARMLFKYGKVGGEIPAQLYAAVAEILAWVYRVNAYRYYREDQVR